MKLQTITFAALIALTGTASADWFDGFNNGSGNGNGYGTATGNTNGAGNAAGNGNVDGNGWGTAKGDADGEVDFAITFKGKGKTNMDTAGNLTGNGQGAGNTAGNYAGNGNTAGNFSGNGYGQGDNTGYGSSMPFNNSNNRGYAPAPAAFAPAAAAQPNYNQLKAMWEAQRKQADEMLKRIEAAQKTAAPNFLPNEGYSAGLQEYLQAGQTTDSTPATSIPQKASAETTDTKSTSQLTHIIEMVVAGVVASALIISLLVLFLGRWAARKDKQIIQLIRQEAQQEREHITAAATTVREQEKETTEIVRNIREQATDINSRQEKISHQETDIETSVEKVKVNQEELEQVTHNVGERMTEIQSYWDEQLHDTVSAIQQVQDGLNNNLKKVDEGLDKMQRQKDMSEQLMQDFLKRHNEQNTVLENNSKISDKVSESLEETLKESTHLLQTLKKQQKDADQALSHFNEELSGYEEQAYEQFDSSFQVADIARQELSANIEESRKHLESMRRYEEQSHSINAQTQKHLETLDFTKIVKLSHTLNSTQDMFTDLRDSVEEAQSMLDELKDIETDVKETASSVQKKVERIDDDSSAIATEKLLDGNDITDADKFIEEMTGEKFDAEIPNDEINTENVNFDYKIASGDNTPLSFFQNLKPQKEKIN
ncbi:hypothetical protein GQR58_003232 [Nymphon striatum]|nr:hypothetical protein GQR58_003232 [Nymphon striatum]